MTDEEDVPIEGLANLENEVSPQFLGGVRRKIFRTTAAAQLARFSWTMPIVIFFEFIQMIAHAISSGTRKGQP